MLIWINGPFGVGKTALGSALSSTTGFPMFDPENIGFLMRETIPASPNDFQDLPAWRRLVPSFAAELIESGANPLIAVQSVLNATYWDEIEGALEDSGIQILHVLVDADKEVLAQRIQDDDYEIGARRWRLDNAAIYESSREWMTAKAELVIDSNDLTPQDSANRVTRYLAEAYSL